jgi:hypothetical protein
MIPKSVVRRCTKLHSLLDDRIRSTIASTRALLNICTFLRQIADAKATTMPGGFPVSGDDFGGSSAIAGAWVGTIPQPLRKSPACRSGCKPAGFGRIRTSVLRQPIFAFLGS